MKLYRDSKERLKWSRSKRRQTCKFRDEFYQFRKNEYDCSSRIAIFFRETSRNYWNYYKEDDTIRALRCSQEESDPISRIFQDYLLDASEIVYDTMRKEASHANE